MSDDQRQLVTLRVITDKKDIPGADRIEAVRVDGWWVVTRKSEFAIDDPVLFFEIDSVLPDTPAFHFLMEKSGKTFPNGKFGARLRTVRLRKQLSQGLVLPLSDFPDVNLSGDIADQLGVWKYEPPVSVGSSGDVAGAWPAWLPQSNQERVQNIDLENREWCGNDFHVEEKVDGSSMTIWMNEDRTIGVGSHRQSLKCGSEDNIGNLFVEAAREYIPHCFDNVPDTELPFAIQGELIGLKMQGNPYMMMDRQFLVYDIIQPRHGGKWTTFKRKRWVRDNGFKGVPDIGAIELDNLKQISDGDSFNITDFLINKADGRSLLAPVLREGLVFKSRIDGNISFKVISNARLLKEA